MCSGSLITLQLVLTAAHCVQVTKDTGSYSYADMTLHAGYSIGSSVQVRRSLFCVSRKIASPFYMGSHDIAVIKSDTPFEPAYGVAPIPIAFENFQPGTKCIMAGHGRRPGERDERCMIVSMIQTGCTSEATGCPPSEIIGPEPMNICPIAEDGKGVCSGDSGSALVCHGSIYAVAHAISYRRNASYAEKRIPIGENCGSSSVLSIYVNLYPYKDWLHKAIAKLQAATASALSIYANVRGDTTVKQGIRVLAPVLASRLVSSWL